LAAAAEVVEHLITEGVAEQVDILLAQLLDY
jgi:hypothetical protein